MSPPQRGATPFLPTAESLYSLFHARLPKLCVHLLKLAPPDSGDFLAALRTELRCNLKLGAAVRTFILGTKRLAAFGTELGALRPRAASGAERGSLYAEIDILCQVEVSDLSLDLLHSGLSLGRRQLRLHV